jgi:hypothetical protein
MVPGSGIATAVIYLLVGIKTAGAGRDPSELWDRMEWARVLQGSRCCRP